MADPHDLERFVRAQAGVWPTALAELRAGAKRSHWMWFVFPQMAGLGQSAMARRYGLSGLAETVAYRAHPVLGPRLAAATDALLALPEGTDLGAVLGGVDAMKFRSSMTLFEAAVPDEMRFAAALARFCEGVRCARTFEMLRDQSSPGR